MFPHSLLHAYEEMEHQWLLCARVQSLPRAGFLLVNGLQHHIQNVELQTSSLPWVSPLHGVFSTHQPTLAHKEENTKHAL